MASRSKQRISSKLSRTYKWVMPGSFCVILALILGISLHSWLVLDKFHALTLLAPVLFGLFIYLLTKNLLRGLVDEVWDHGDFLTIRNRDIEQRVDLADIVNISISHPQKPVRLTLMLRHPGELGEEVVFMPATRFNLNPSHRPPIYRDLALRIDAAKRS